MAEPLLVKQEASVLHLTLNRLGKKNALSKDLMQALLEALHAMKKDTRIVLIDGNGSFFCAGLDLEETLDDFTNVELIAELFETLVSIPAVTIAKVQGGAYAGGVGLIAACDLAFASDEAVFSLPELKRGLLPGFVFTLLENQISKRSLNELVLTAKPILATKAHQMSLVHEVVPLDQLDSFCEDTMQQILQNAPLATARYKKEFIQSKMLKERFKEVLKLHRELRTKPEAKEGCQAFIEKRPPHFN